MLTPLDWQRLEFAIRGVPGVADIKAKIDAYMTSRELHAKRDPRIHDPWSQTP